MKMERLLRKFLVMGIVALFLGVVGSAFFKVDVNVKAVGATIYVDDDNTTGPWDGTEDHPCQNITSGLEQASDGDTVHVFSGTYVENVVVDKSVTLEGESKPVINGMTGHGIDVTANDVTIEGFNITYSGYCIYTGTSGFSIKNNIFWHDFDYDFYGIYWYISESSLAENYTVYPAVIEGNEFYMSGMYDAIYVNVNLDCGSNSGYNVEIGDIQICNNKFYMEGSTARGIDIGDIYVAYLYGGTVSFGVLNMSGNTMYGGDYGINFYGYLDDLQDVQASVGDVIVNDNILVNQSSYSMYVDYYDGTYLYGNTVGTYGDLIIRGNTITSVYNAYGIYISDIGYWEEFYDNASLEVGNVYIEENEIDVGDDGIYVYGYDAGYDLYDNSSFTMGYILVRDNNIKSDSAGIYVDFEIFGNYLYGASPFTMGNIEITSNLISNTYDGIYFYMYAFGYEMYGTSSFMMGSILANNNAINSTDYGICVDYIGDFGGAMYGNSSFTMGDIQLSGNTINSGNDGIHVDDIENFGVYMEENSTFAMGNIESSGNTINSTYFGICTIDLVHQFGYYMTGHSSFTMGHIRVNENVINNEGGSTGYNNAGIYVEYIEYLGNYMYNMSTFVMGNIEVSNNRINSTTYGIYLYEIDYSGYQMYDDSSFAMGDLLVNNNIINSAGDGMYLEYIEYFGQIMYGNSSFTMSNVQISGNVVNSTQRGIFIEDLYEFGSYMHDTSSFTMSNIEISNNKINSTLEGIYIQSFYHAYYMYNNASFAIEDILVNGNIINSKDNGIVLREAYHHTRFGYNAIDNATIITGNVEFCQNEITGGIDGIDLADLQNATIRNNIMQNCSLGIYLQDSANNSIYHNNFINNTLQAYVRALYTSTPHCNNTWDNGYPSGGNYWSDYTGVDLYSGPDQDIPGSDFRGDTAYVVDSNNTDHYPLTIPYETQPPTIIILSPENKTYAVNANIPLTFTIDEPADWIGYSLYEQANVTITGNTTLPVLSDGSHYMIVYANDTFNNMGMSSVYFTVDTTPPATSISMSGALGGNDWFTSDVTVTLSAPDDTEIDKTEYSFDNVTWTTYTTPFTITNEGNKTVYYKSTDKVGNPETAKSKTVKIDKTIPSGSITINNNAPYTTSTSVTLTLTATDATSGVHQVRFSHDNTTWVPWETYSTSKTWTLTTGDGTKTVYVQFIDNAGLTSTSYQDTITLDTTKPTANAGQDQTVNVGDTVAFDAGDSTDNVGIGSYEWDFGDETSGTGKTATHEYMNIGTYTVTLTVEDAAGNQATDTMVVTVNAAEAFPWWTVAAVGVVAAGVAVAAVILWRRRKKT